MRKENKFKRRVFWIEPRLQMKYIVFNVAYLMFFALIIGGGIYLGIWRSVTREFSEAKVGMNLQEMKRIQEYQLARTNQEADSIPIISGWSKMLSDHDKQTFNSILMRANRTLVPFAAVMAFVIVLLTILLSHRIAGPVYRLKRGLKAVIEGDLTVRFSLREKDELKELAAGIDTAVHGFAEGIDKVKHCLENYGNSQSEQDKRKYISEAEAILSKFTVVHH